ncbi:MAG: hypothetical protein QOG01_372 [Pseudonocardiales bacterium]|jgi:hypothetical protein|nr:hypothetical protein [Pseudonocardiales bacterium]
MRTLLPFLILLGCPSMMIFMMRGGHGSGHGDQHDEHGPPRSREARIAALEREVAELREEPGREPVPLDAARLTARRGGAGRGPRPGRRATAPRT